MRPPPDDENELPDRPPIRRLPKTRHGMPPPEDQDDDVPELPIRRTEPVTSEPRTARLPWLMSVLLQNVFTLMIVVLLAGLLGLLWWSRTGLVLSQANFDQLQNGMTEAQVVAILGGAANAKPPQVREQDVPQSKTPPVWRAWQDETTLVLLAFVEGKLHYKQRLSLFH